MRPLPVRQPNRRPWQLAAAAVAFLALIASCSSGSQEIGGGGTVVPFTTITNTVPVPNAVAVAVSASGDSVYVSSPSLKDENLRASIKVIDPSTATVTDSITVATHPMNIAIAESTARAYISISSRDPGEITILDSTNHGIIKTVDAPNLPGDLAVSADEAKVYFVDTGDGETSSGTGNADGVSILDTATNTVSNMIRAGKDPKGVALSTDNLTLYVASHHEDTILVIDTETETVRGTIPVAEGPDRLALTKDDRTLYATTGESLAVIDTSTNAVTSSIPFGSGNVRDVHLSPEDSTVYVTFDKHLADCTSPPPTPSGPDGEHATNEDGTPVTGALVTIDAATNAKVHETCIGKYANRIALSPEGQLAYVSVEGLGQLAILSP